MTLTAVSGRAVKAVRAARERSANSGNVFACGRVSAPSIGCLPCAHFKLNEIY